MACIYCFHANGTAISILLRTLNANKLGHLTLHTSFAMKNAEQHQFFSLFHLIHLCTHSIQSNDKLEKVFFEFLWADQNECKVFGVMLAFAFTVFRLR